MSKREISNRDNILDSRDVIKRIEELEGCIDEDKPEENDADDVAELKALKALAEEGEGSPDWNHGETLINESYFEDYARELAEETGAIDSKAGWPLHCIDWGKAADELKADYMSVDYDGVTYYIRA